MLNYIDTETGQYPMQQPEIAALFPETSFAQPFTPPERFQVVMDDPTPIYDRLLDFYELGEPLIREGKYVREWTVYPLPEEDANVNLKKERDELKTIADSRRMALEAEGIGLPGGIQVKTTIEEQNRITTTLVSSENAGFETVDYLAASGWVTLTLQELKDISAAVGRRMRELSLACRDHFNAIDLLRHATHFDEYRQTTIFTNWPEAESGDDEGGDPVED